MKKLLVSLSIGIMAFTPEEIVKKIDVKKEIEDFLEARGAFLVDPLTYKSYTYMEIYRTCTCLYLSLKPYLYEYLRNVKIKGDSQLNWYIFLFDEMMRSTHITLGEVIKVEIDAGGYCGERLPLPSRMWIKILKVFKGKFKKDIIPIWVFTGYEEGLIAYPSIHQGGFVGDTLLLFLRDLPPQCPNYAREHGNDLNYSPGEFFPVSSCATYPVLTIQGEKRLTGCEGEKLNLPYKRVIDMLNFFLPICEKLENEAKKYKFPLTEEEYAEFMKKRGYNYPLTEEDFEKINKKFEKRWEK